LNVQVAFVAATSGTETTAKGMIQAINQSGTDSGSLNVTAHGLAPGLYTVSGVSLSSTTPVTIGTFEVGSNADTDSPASPPRYGGPLHRGHHLEFPSALDPFNVGSLAISDSNANVLFTADLATIANAVFVAQAPVVSGTATLGSAGIHAVARDGVIHGGLTLCATGLTASATYNYSVDGTSAGTATADANGSLRFKATESSTGGTLPGGIDLFTVTIVTVTDSSGNLVLSASF